MEMNGAPWETSGSAGGLGQLDSSGNGPIPQIVVRGVSPHLDPLPQGEETARLARWRAERSGLLAAERTAHPLPKGEGRGEGKRSTHRTAQRDFAGSSCGRCPQADIWLCAIHDFMPP